MTPDLPSLSQHLLTRTDLAQLAISEATVAGWLASGELLQIGTLSQDAADGEPVFAVTAPSLREDLAARLADIGKGEVVFSPLRVRSVLMRALLALHGSVNVEVAGAPAAGAGAITVEDVLGEALAEVAHDLEREVERFLEMARDEARLEALERAAEFAAQEALETPVDAEPEPEFQPDFEPAEPPGEEGEFFDFEDLTNEMSTWGHEPEPTPEPDALDIPGEPTADAVTTTEMTEAEPAVDPSQNAIEADVFAAFDAFEKPTATRAAEQPQDAEHSIQQDVFAAFEAFELAPGEQPDAGLVEPEVAAALAAEEPMSADMPPEPPDAGTATATAADAQAVEPPGDTFAEPGMHSQQPEAPASVAASNRLPEPEAAFPPKPAAEAARTDSVATAAVGNQAFERVESFLSELKSALLEIAQRPQAMPQPAPQVQVQAVDMQPLVAAVGEFGQRIEHGVAIAVHAAMASNQPKPASAPAQLQYVHAPANRNHFVLMTVTLLLTCWAGIFWLKTGSASLALGTFLGANAIACCLLVGQRR